MFVDLAPEVWSIIAFNHGLTPRDLLSLAQTCKYLNQVVFGSAYAMARAHASAGPFWTSSRSLWRATEFALSTRGEYLNAKKTGKVLVRAARGGDVVINAKAPSTVVDAGSASEIAGWRGVIYQLIVRLGADPMTNAGAPVRFAAQHGDLPVLAILLLDNAYIRSLDKRALLTHSPQPGSSELIPTDGDQFDWSLLWRPGVDVSVCDHEAAKAVIAANRDPDAIAMLLSHPSSSISHTSLLSDAIQRGYDVGVRVLLDLLGATGVSFPGWESMETWCTFPAHNAASTKWARIAQAMASSSLFSLLDMVTFFKVKGQDHLVKALHQAFPDSWVFAWHDAVAAGEINVLNRFTFPPGVVLAGGRLMSYSLAVAAGAGCLTSVVWLMNRPYYVPAMLHELQEVLLAAVRSQSDDVFIHIMDEVQMGGWSERTLDKAFRIALRKRRPGVANELAGYMSLSQLMVCGEAITACPTVLQTLLWRLGEGDVRESTLFYMFRGAAVFEDGIAFTMLIESENYCIQRYTTQWSDQNLRSIISTAILNCATVPLRILLSRPAFWWHLPKHRVFLPYMCRNLEAILANEKHQGSELSRTILEHQSIWRPQEDKSDAGPSGGGPSGKEEGGGGKTARKAKGYSKRDRRKNRRKRGRK